MRDSDCRQESVTWLWDDDKRFDFLVQKRLIEERFEREGLLSVLQGFYHVKYAFPAPIFPYALPGYRQPGLYVKQSIPREEMQILEVASKYNDRLMEFEDRYANWSSGKSAYDRMIRKADRVFYEVFGSNARMDVHDVLMQHGIAAAWESIVKKNTPVASTKIPAKAVPVRTQRCRSKRAEEVHELQTRDMETHESDDSIDEGQTGRQRSARSSRAINAVAKKLPKRIVSFATTTNTNFGSNTVTKKQHVTPAGAVRTGSGVAKEIVEHTETSIVEDVFRESTVSVIPSPMPRVEGSVIESCGAHNTIPIEDTQTTKTFREPVDLTTEEVPAIECAGHRLSAEEVPATECAGHRLSAEEVP
eukprot:gene24808-28039_t